MEWLRHIARQIAREFRILGLWRSIGIILIFPALVLFSLVSATVEVCFPTLHAWPRMWRLRRYNAKMERRFREKFGNGVDGDDLDPDLETQLRASTAQDVKSRHGIEKDSFFGLFPPEIRRQILVAAFGDHIIHTDLKYRPPYRQRNLQNNDHQHTGYILDGRFHSQFKVYGKGEERWRWFSCICHHHPPGTPSSWMSHGRRGLSTKMASVSCIEGNSECWRWHGRWPEKCHVGAMGWLTTCKQAYFEGVDVLYRTNTFNIASPVLLRSFHSVIPRQMRLQLCSLTLVWDLYRVRLSDSFTYPNDPSSTSVSRSEKTPIFPSLVHLRLALDPFVRDQESLNDFGLPNPLWDDTALTARRLQESFYPRMERLLDRIAASTADITLTLSDWELYERIDMDLVERQGLEKTRLQRSEYGGLKCWKERDDDATRGYWIHIGTDYMGLDQTSNYDWERHRMYNLGQNKYECTWRGFWRDGFILEAW